jgi:hypothetical protein
LAQAAPAAGQVQKRGQGCGLRRGGRGVIGWCGRFVGVATRPRRLPHHAVAGGAAPAVHGERGGAGGRRQGRQGWATRTLSPGGVRSGAGALGARPRARRRPERAKAARPRRMAHTAPASAVEKAGREESLPKTGRRSISLLAPPRAPARGCPGVKGCV